MIVPTFLNFSALVSLSEPMIWAIRWNCLFASFSAGVSASVNETWSPSIATFDSRWALTSSICEATAFSERVVPYLSAHACCSLSDFEPSANIGSNVW